MSPRAPWEERVAALLGTEVRGTAPLAGGCVGEVHRVDLAGGRRVVAKVDGSGGDTLAIEGRMLRSLGEVDAVPVPEVLACEDDLLVMEYCPSGPSSRDRVEAHAAELLAKLHGHSAERHGLDFDTVIGGLHQPNPWTERWLDFFRDQRLLAMADQAHGAGRLPADLRRRIDALAARLDRWLLEPAHPSLLHGDVWSGNVLTGDRGVVAFLDPAIYYGHPEVELAFVTLFGTFGETFFREYQARRPLDDGFFEERRDLYNLYPLLVHVRLFGGSYVGSVASTLSRYGV